MFIRILRLCRILNDDKRISGIVEFTKFCKSGGMRNRPSDSAIFIYVEYEFWSQERGVTMPATAMDGDFTAELQLGNSPALRLYIHRTYSCTQYSSLSSSSVSDPRAPRGVCRSCHVCCRAITCAMRVRARLPNVCAMKIFWPLRIGAETAKYSTHRAAAHHHRTRLSSPRPTKSPTRPRAP